MILGVDYSFDRPELHHLWNMGFRVVVRYLTDQEDNGKAKLLTKTERDALWAHGFDISLVWETTKDRPLAGYEAGLQDAVMANKLARELDFPDNKLIWVAFDRNFTYNEVEPYARGWYAGRQRIGGYGHKFLLDELYDNQLIVAQWQAGANAWSDYQLARRVSMVQRVPVGVTDINTIDETHPDFKQWAWSKPTSPITPRAKAALDEVKAAIDVAAAGMRDDPASFQWLWDASVLVTALEQERK